MTGFGRAAFRVERVAFDLEVRSLNHRYLEARVRLPRALSAHEVELRQRVRGRFARGKLDLTVVAADSGAAGPRLEIDLEAARQYARAAEQLRQAADLPGTLEVDAVLALPGVSRFVEPELSAEALGRELLAATDAALDAVEEMRAAEGAALGRELLGRLERVGALADQLEARAGVAQAAVRERLRKRAKQLQSETGLLDEARLHQEVVLAADRLDFTEEVVRLRSHVELFRTAVEEAGAGRPVGRRLDFLLQEFGREANTIGSKASDAPIAHDVVELKTELERLREQVQNVE